MKILVCDDDFTFGIIISRILKSLGNYVEFAHDGREAQEKIRDKPDFFDVLITDNLMPRLSGVELIEKLRMLNVPLKVIMMTGFPNELNAVLQASLRLNGLLCKPFKSDALLDCLASLGCDHERQQFNGACRQTARMPGKLFPLKA